ncbi:MAG TPA: glycoside hydrolase family 11 protein, partial [Ruminococcus flavefaciens]|nr:glycoside hydrolase family 11 protein [Ruminococcus flavefaciens]
MKNKSVRRSVAGALASLMCALSVPAIPTAVYSTAYAASAGQKLSVGGGQTQHKGDNVDGYSYEIWLDRTGGSGSMTLGSGGSFDAQWSAEVSQGNFLARRGRNYDASKKATDYGPIVMDYAAQYSASAKGNSRLCVYGWFKDPLVEYYIIEDWVNWCPSGNGKTVTIDGAQYDIFQTPHTGPTILGDTRTFQQYFSVRKQKRTSGTITVSDHFKAWANAGMQIGNLTEVALNVEGWESSGRANVTKLTIGTSGGGGNNQQQNNNNGWNQPQQQNNGWNNNQSNTASTPTKQADANGYYFNSSFNSGVDGWTGRGAATVAKDSSNYAEGNGSIFVSGRTDNWNGAAIELDPSAFGAGQTYSFGAAVMQKSESSTSMKMTLQYTDASGTEQYNEVATATASNGKWTALGNPSYTIPSGASNLLLYIEAPDSLTDFYVDSAFGGVKGKSVSVSGGTTAQNNNNQQQNWNQPQQQNNNQQQNNWNQPQQQTNNNTASQGTGLKGKFAPWFKIGTSVSPHELNSGASFLKENYNSITPENELKPDSILDQQACQQRGNNVNTQVNLSRAAQTLKFCEDNGISLRGHTFVWYSQTPDWFFRENFSQNGAYVSPQIMDQRLESFIKNTFDALKTQYPKLDIYSYDVCNELFVNDGGGLRPANNSNWVRVYGDDSFVIKAFQYARKYAPANCKL